MSALFERSKSYKPFNYPWAIDRAIEHEKIHWGEWEANLQDDVNQWKSGFITDDEKEHITQILRLFTQSDCEVENNYCDVFIPIFKNNEVRQLLVSIANRESVHQRAYALLNDTLGMEESEYSAFLDVPEMNARVANMSPARFDIHSDDQTTARQNLGYALGQTIINEGIALFSAFAMLLNYQRFGKMKGTCEIVEWSLVDESAHVEDMLLLFRTMCEECPEILTDEFKATLYTMYKHAVDLEIEVVNLTYANDTIEGLKRDEVVQYIYYMADRRLIQLGLKPNYGVDQNPLPWMEWITSATSFKNFFEGRVTDYSKDSLEGDMFENPYILHQCNVEIYSMPNCPKCVKAKNLLKINNIEFEELLFTETIDVFQKTHNTTVRSAPQIVVNGELIGGFEDLQNKFSFHRKMAS